MNWIKHPTILRGKNVYSIIDTEWPDVKINLKNKLDTAQ